MTDQPSGPPPPMTPERARHVARAYKALAENIAEIVPGEAILPSGRPSVDGLCRHARDQTAAPAVNEAEPAQDNEHGGSGTRAVTPEQCIQARELLGWSRVRLA